MIPQTIPANEPIEYQPLIYYKVKVLGQVWSGKDQRDIGGEMRIVASCHPFLERDFGLWPFPCELVEFYKNGKVYKVKKHVDIRYEITEVNKESG